jgi:hypothetical protein
MGPKFLDSLFSSACSHAFSWPRRTTAGKYYQVCLRCGDEYWYDWKSMRRTSRLNREELREKPSGSPGRWSPRARRLKVSIPLQYRRKGSLPWSSGVATNISQTGILFDGEQELLRGNEVELVFEMPKEISGQVNSRVLCLGSVIRSVQAAEKSVLASFAVAIKDSKFIESGSPMQRLEELQVRVREASQIERLPARGRRKSRRSN